LVFQLGGWAGGLKTPRRKEQIVTKCYRKALAGSFEYSNEFSSSIEILASQERLLFTELVGWLAG
jgi:hypothetical protein